MDLECSHRPPAHGWEARSCFHTAPLRDAPAGTWWKDWGLVSGIPVCQPCGLGPALLLLRMPISHLWDGSRDAVLAVVSTKCVGPSEPPPHAAGHASCFFRVPCVTYDRGAGTESANGKRARTAPTLTPKEPRMMAQWLQPPIRSQGQQRPRASPRFLPT